MQSFARCDHLKDHMKSHQAEQHDAGLGLNNSLGAADSLQGAEQQRTGLGLNTSLGASDSLQGRGQHDADLGLSPSLGASDSLQGRDQQGTEAGSGPEVGTLHNYPAPSFKDYHTEQQAPESGAVIRPQLGREDFRVPSYL